MRSTRALVLVVVVLGMPALAAPVAGAATFVVNVGSDTGDGVCDGVECTLREAITAANAAGGSDTIAFTTGAETIVPDSTLPAITSPAIIDGATMPGYVDEPLVSLLGNGIASQGLHITAGSTTVRGLRITGSAGNAITIDTAGGNTIQGNAIGQPFDRNGGAGIAISSSGNTIGGVLGTQANTIDGNAGDAVSVVSGTGNVIRGNVIRNSGGLAIDLAPDGRSANDALDTDVGANDLQNFPALTSVTVGASDVTVAGTLNSKANTLYVIDVYAATACGGQGTEYLGSVDATTNGAGAASFNPTFPVTSTGAFGVATATDPAGNTSEFSVALPASGTDGITPACDPLDIAKAIAVDQTTVTGAAFVTVPPGGTPNAVATGSYGGFPTDGSSYGVLSSGSAGHLAPGGASGGGIDGANVRGNTDRDVTILRIDLSVPTSANCLTLDFRFLSDEFPSFVGTSFNDAFLAELDTSSWSTAGSAITNTENNFAFDPSNDVISINSTGSTAMSQAEAAGTGYSANGATPLLHASRVVTPGAHQLFLSIFDQGDSILDSAVELDKLIFTNRPAAACASGATSDVTPPVVTLVTPANSSTTPDSTPTYSGAAGVLAGDLPTVTVKIYAGATATGTPVQTLTATQAGGAWTIDGTTPLAPGTYTAQAEQSDSAGNTGFSSANTFTVESGTTLSIDDVTLTEGNSGTTNADFTVTLSEASADTVTVHYATADSSATQPADYTATSGDLSFAPGDLTKHVLVPVKGDTLDEINETFAVTITAPVNASIGDGTGVGTITDDDDPPALSVSDQTVTEGNAGTTNATFTVSLSGASGKTVTVNYATANATAAAPGDYTATTGSLTFAPGQTSKTVDVPVVGDPVDEHDETFQVNLSTQVNATLADGQGIGTITDDDPAPTLSINDRSQAEGNAGTSTMTFTVSLSAASSKTALVNFATSDGTASQPTDYTSVGGVLTFNPGDISKTVTVTINGDTSNEVDETLIVTLATPTNATLADATGTGTIVNDDVPSASIGNVTVTEGNAGTTNADVTVSLSSASLQTVTVHYATADGTATQPGDYAAASGTLTFDPGQTSKTFAVPVIGDTAVEPDETFTVGLSAPSNATLGTATATGTIINDDTAGPPTAPVVPVISIGNTSVSPEGDTGTRPASFTVSLSAATTQAVSVTYATANGTASAPADYAAAAPATLTFAAGQTSKTVTVAVAGDTLVEANETFRVQLSDPVAATLGSAQGTGTIFDDDTPPKIRVPGGVKSDGVFCGTQHRGRCNGLAFEATFTSSPGNASWTFDVYNPNPGKRSSRSAAVRYVRAGSVRKAITKPGKVKVKFVVRGSRANRLLRQIRTRGLSRMRITTTYVTAAGKRTKTVSTVKLR